MSAADQPENKQELTRLDVGWMVALLIAILLGLIGVLWATAAKGLGILVAGTFLLLGAIIGLLFGIPRALQQEKVIGDSAGSGTSSAGSGTASGYRPNTNLEQISDWLTKILVGVGLTQKGMGRVEHGVIGSILRAAPSVLVEKQTGFTESLDGLFQPVAHQGTQLLGAPIQTGMPSRSITWTIGCAPNGPCSSPRRVVTRVEITRSLSNPTSQAISSIQRRRVGVSSVTTR
jgi:hypothetical protein